MIEWMCPPTAFTAAEGRLRFHPGVHIVVQLAPLHLSSTKTMGIVSAKGRFWFHAADRRGEFLYGG